MNKQYCPFCGAKKKPIRPTCDRMECIELDVRSFSLGYGYSGVYEYGLNMTGEGKMKKNHTCPDDRANQIST